MLAVLIAGQFGGVRGYKPRASHTLASSGSEKLLLSVLKTSRLLISAACFVNVCFTEGSAASQSCAASSLPGVPF